MAHSIYDRQQLITERSTILDVQRFSTSKEFPYFVSVPATCRTRPGHAGWIYPYSGNNVLVCRLTVNCTDASNPLPNRAKRLHASTKAVENLYYQHAANDRSITSPLNTTFQSVPPSNPKSNQRENSSYPIPGFQLSRQVLEGETPRPANRNGPQYTRVTRDRDGVLDARGLAARSQQRPYYGPISRTSPTNAGGLRARPQESQGNPGTRRLDPKAFGPREDTIGLEERQRFPPRQTSQVERPRKASPSTTDQYQDRSERQNINGGDYPRADRGFLNGGGSSSDMPMRPANQNGRPGRGNFSSRTNTQGDRPGRVRSGRGQQGRQSRPRQRDRQAAGSGNASNSKHSEPKWSEEEEEYFESKRKREAAQPVDYEPASMTEETFTGVRPAVISGDQGMSQVLDERLMIAKRCLEGGFVEWQSREQKADVMTLVERLKGAGEDRINKQESEGSQSSASEAEKQTQSLLQKLLAGKYELSKPPDSKGVLDHVARYTYRNESYYPDDQRSLLEKVMSLIPKDDQRTPGRHAKPKVKN